MPVLPVEAKVLVGQLTGRRAVHMKQDGESLMAHVNEVCRRRSSFE